MRITGAAIIKISCLIIFSGMVKFSFAQKKEQRKWGDFFHWGDLGNGQYQNPVLPADFSDIDCIRVGDDYYAISSTFQYSPGIVIIHSKDLVNWDITGHVVNDITQIGNELNWDKMNRYGKGIWAGAIRYHDNKFLVYFGTPDEGYFMTTAENIDGPWQPLHRVLADSGWDDCCPFWDDDGQGYFVGTNFSDNYKTYIYKLSPDGRDIIADSRKLINQGWGREANKLYKFNNYYYHLFSEYKSAKGRYLMMQRSKNILGPYKEIKQLNHADRKFMEPNQGGLVQTQKGKWYFYTHHGTGDWAGRINSLLPVTWIKGWPIIGKPGADGIGSMVWGGDKPAASTPVVKPQTSDEFTDTLLLPQWEWNYQPRSDKFSLSQRLGWLRLYAFMPIAKDELSSAGNTLTQRSYRTSNNEVIIKMDIGKMADGEYAGLCHFAPPNAASIGIVQKGTKRFLRCRIQNAATERVLIKGNEIWFRSTWGLNGNSKFSYSINGKDFIHFGAAYQLAGGSYRGDRIGIFNYNNVSESGYVDIDFLHYSYSGITHPQ